MSTTATVYAPHYNVQGDFCECEIRILEDCTGVCLGWVKTSLRLSQGKHVIKLAGVAVCLLCAKGTCDCATIPNFMKNLGRRPKLTFSKCKYMHKSDKGTARFAGSQQKLCYDCMLCIQLIIKWFSCKNCFDIQTLKKKKIKKKNTLLNNNV